MSPSSPLEMSTATPECGWVVIPHAGEADGVRVVKVVVLLPEGMVFTDFQQVVDDAAVHGGLPLTP